ncbi:MAG: methyl-accepting chemotaxis protein [Polyangiales bacterium]|jgi:methyl-accepting chemotaxis protein
MKQKNYDALSESLAIVELDRDGTIRSANSKFSAALGYQPGELNGRNRTVLVPKGSDLGSTWYQVLNGQTVGVDLEHVAKNGDILWFRCTYTPVRDDDGEVQSVIKVVEDVTKSKFDQMEAQGKLAALGKVQAVIEFKLDGTIISFNENFTNVFGYSLEELRGKHHRTLVDKKETEGEEYAAHWRKLATGELLSGEYRRFGKGGKEVWLQASYSPICDDNGVPYKVVKFATDITALVETRNQAVMLKNVVDKYPTPTMTLDPWTMKITYANEASMDALRKLEKHLPIKADSIVGTCIDGVHGARAAEIRAILQDPANLPHEARVRLGPEHAHMNVFALYDGDGKYAGPALAWGIITDTVQMEEREAKAKAAVVRVQEALALLAQGNFDVTIEETFEGDLDAMRTNVNGIGDVLRGFLHEVGSMLKAAQDGDLSVRADPRKFGGSYEQMILGVNHMVDALLSPLSAIRESLGKVASGDLTSYITEEYQGEHGALKAALNETLDDMNKILFHVSNSSNTIASSASEVAASSQGLSQGASEQAATVEEISSQMTQITHQTRQNAENATQANQLAEAARDGAQDGDQQMAQMVAAMTAIEEGSVNISKIIKVIDEIAFQTNLLALNAAVEAARAGVHGRGFAVVAEEVRNLAARSASAAKETAELIEGSIKQVSAGTLIANDTAKALGAIVRDVGKVTSLVAEIAAASSEQADAITQTNVGLDQINLVTQRNTATSEESAAASQEMLSQVEKMQNMLSQFTLRPPTPEGGNGMPQNFSPEMMAALQMFMAERGLNRNVPPSQPQPSTNHTRQSNNSANHAPGGATRVILDATEFGKY